MAGLSAGGRMAASYEDGMILPGPPRRGGPLLS